MPDEPLAHIRRPNPPWRDEYLTECGKLEADVARTISCDDAVAMVKDLGQQRASLFLCQTCTATASRHSAGRYGGIPQPQDWNRDPGAVMSRYLERISRWHSDAQADQIRAELTAIGMLVDAHRDEFDETLAGLLSTESLTARRAENRMREQMTGRRRRR